MEITMFLSFFCALLGGFALPVLVKAQDLSAGSIEVGATASNDETSDTKKYLSEATLIETGTSKSILSDFQAKQFWTGVRSFPEGLKNCYSLGSRGKIEDHGCITGLTPVEIVERLKNGSLTCQWMDIEASLGENPSISGQQKDKRFVLPLAASAVSLFFLSIASTVFSRLNRRRNQKGFSEKRSVSFTYSEILQITDNFKRVLGEDGFGTTYHGYLYDNQVTVKMLFLSSSSGREYEEFEAEVKILTRVHHRNLTNLIGYCNEDTNIGLVYEYMASGNLQQHLSDRNTTILSWENRLRIALDVAQGLEYLHKVRNPPIVHGAIKTANILLNENFEAKLADFGLSSIFPSTIVSGTLGYIDPEYYLTNWFDEKTDVYSFGVVLMEIVTNRPVIGKPEEGNIHISQWLIDRIETGDMENIADPGLDGDFGSSSAWKVVELALACAYHVSSKRPTMEEAVMELKECLAMELAWKKDLGKPRWQ